MRFLLLMAAAWIGLRVVMLWPTIDSIPALVRAIVPAAAARPRPVSPAPRRRWRMTPAPVPQWHRALATPPQQHPPLTAYTRRVATGRLGFARFGRPEDRTNEPPLLPGLPRSVAAPAAMRPRFSGSFWLVARGGGGRTSGLVGGQLGGSQAGLRLAYAVDAKRRLALAARLTAPLGPGMRELALGVEWQPTRFPVRLVAEERIAIDGGSSGPGLGVVGGAGPIPLGGGFQLEGYGQAGAIRRDRTEPYVDGAVHLSRPIVRIGKARIDLGAGAWGAAQRGAARIDIGPSLTLAVPLARQPVRLSLDWRERVAGAARPGSGLALTLGADF